MYTKFTILTLRPKVHLSILLLLNWTAQNVQRKYSQDDTKSLSYTFRTMNITIFLCVVTCWMLSAEPHVLCSFSLLCPTPRKLLNASVVLLTLTFKEPILKKRKSFSAMRIYNYHTQYYTNSIQEYKTLTLLDFTSEKRQRCPRECYKGIRRSRCVAPLIVTLGTRRM